MNCVNLSVLSDAVLPGCRTFLFYITVTFSVVAASLTRPVNICTQTTGMYKGFSWLALCRYEKASKYCCANNSTAGGKRVFCALDKVFALSQTRCTVVFQFHIIVGRGATELKIPLLIPQREPNKNNFLHCHTRNEVKVTFFGIVNVSELLIVMSIINSLPRILDRLNFKDIVDFFITNSDK